MHKVGNEKEAEQGARANADVRPEFSQDHLDFQHQQPRGSSLTLGKFMFVEDADFSFERVARGRDVILRATHAPSSKSVERVSAFGAESKFRKDMIAELRRAIAADFPNEHLLIEHMWCGPGKGAALRLRHVPTGKFVDRVIGYESATAHQREMFAELLQLLR